MCSASKTTYPVTYTGGHVCETCVYHHPDGRNCMGEYTGRTCGGNNRILPEEQKRITHCSIWMAKAQREPR